MRGKVVLITGGTGGIGLRVAAGLAKLGAKTIVVGRDAERGRSAVAEIEAETGSKTVDLLPADLSSLRQVENLAREVEARYTRLDVLVNNAGALYGRRSVTVDGIEATLALNHLCPFYLTHLLMPLLKISAPSRIVNINSEGHRAAKTVDFSAFEADRWRRGFRIYSQTKLANLLFTYQLAQRLNPSEVTVNAVHPGIVDTQLTKKFLSERFFRPGGKLSKIAVVVMGRVAKRMYKFDTAEAAAHWPIYLASSQEVADISGKYFNCDGKMMQTSPASYDSVLSQRVWDRTLELVGLREAF